MGSPATAVGGASTTGGTSVRSFAPLADRSAAPAAPAATSADGAVAAFGVATNSAWRTGGASLLLSAKRCRDASNISPHCPHRTHPSEIRSWSGTTLNIVSHAGHRVIRLIGPGL